MSGGCISAKRCCVTFAILFWLLGHLDVVCFIAALLSCSSSSGILRPQYCFFFFMCKTSLCTRHFLLLSLDEDQEIKIFLFSAFPTLKPLKVITRSDRKYCAVTLSNCWSFKNSNYCVSSTTKFCYLWGAVLTA